MRVSGWLAPGTIENLWVGVSPSSTAVCMRVRFVREAREEMDRQAGKCGRFSGCHSSDTPGHAASHPPIREKTRGRKADAHNFSRPGNLGAAHSPRGLRDPARCAERRGGLLQFLVGRLIMGSVSLLSQSSSLILFRADLPLDPGVGTVSDPLG